MERLNTNVRALDGSLQQAPKILKAIRVYRSINVCFGMVNNLVGVLGKAIIRFQRIGVQFRTGRYMFPNLAMEMMLPSSINDRRTDFARLTIQQPKHDSLAHRAAPANLFFPFSTVHVARLTADERLVSF